MTSYSSLNEEQERQFRKIFATFDKDGNGSITRVELGQMVKELGMEYTDEELQLMIDEADLDGSGTISVDEFLVLMARKSREPTDFDELRKAFEVFDRNKDGFLSAEELAEIMTTFGERLSDAELADMMEEADIDKDGRINYDEFIMMIMK